MERSRNWVQSRNCLIIFVVFYFVRLFFSVLACVGGGRMSIRNALISAKRGERRQWRSFSFRCGSKTPEIYSRENPRSQVGTENPLTRCPGRIRTRAKRWTPRQDIHQPDRHLHNSEIFSKAQFRVCPFIFQLQIPSLLILVAAIGLRKDHSDKNFAGRTQLRFETSGQ